MGPISGYQTKEKLYESSNSYVFRAFHKDGQRRAIIKILKGEYPTSDRIARFKREYELLTSLNLECVIKAHSLDNYNNSFAMIMEDIGAESLDIILKKRKLNLHEFLELAIKITDVLGKIHHANIIHKNINPSNIIWNPDTNQLKLIDFDISTVLPREITVIHNPNVLEGTLAYISPEQTGRMNRMLDYLTDFYSLGVSFYEILTGQLPFKSSDPMEMVHCHIAKEPRPPHQLKTSLLKGNSPEVLSNIILKLMAKNPEERYQSDFGLRNDLEEALNQLNATGTIKPFEIAQNDISDKFQIPQKLYGRENDIKTLIDSFDRVSGPDLSDQKGEQQRCEMVIVTGYAGIGKSALINEVHKSIVSKRVYFISGKFDQLRQNTPYSALIQAFQQLIRQILTESEEQIAEWKEKILEAVNPNGQVIIDVIPEMELLIGKCPVVPALGPIQSQNRFNLYFQDFIRAIANKEHPLIIVLDDLQWADLPSLKLMELFMLDSRAKNMLFIGAYRDKEVDEYHSLSITLNEIEKLGAKINRITLLPLELRHVNQLVADTLKIDPEKTEELANLCKNKTNGNPFFLKQFLKTLFEERLLEFDTKQMSWRWKTEAIEKTGITDNVVDLMVNKIRKLPEKTQSILKLAACIGNQFDLKTLAVVNEKSMGETAKDLWETLQEELILPLSDSYKYVNMLDIPYVENSDSMESLSQYKFSHDRIQQASYSMINEERKKDSHLKIGRLLLANTNETEREERLFSIVNHINSAVDLIESNKEKSELIHLNLLAGKKAKASAAYKPALDYLQFGMGLLGENSWETQYELTLDFHNEAAEAAYLNSDIEKMDLLSNSVLNNARTTQCKINVYVIKIQSYQAQYNLIEAVNTAIDIMKQLGVHFSQKPTIISILFLWLKVKMSLIGKTTEDLKELPLMTDPNKRAVLQICLSAVNSIYLSNREMVPTISLKTVYITIRYGNSPFAFVTYLCYGLILCGALRSIESGYQFGKLALDMVSKFQSKEYLAKIYLMFNCFIKHWKDHLKETLKPLAEGVQRGLETGDFEYSGDCARVYCFHLLWVNKDLKFMDQEMVKYLEISKKIKQEPVVIAISQFRQFALNLIGNAEDNTRLTGECFNEEEMIPVITKANDIILLSNLYFFKTVLCYLFGDESSFLDNVKNSEKHYSNFIGLSSGPLNRFYNSLTMLSLCSASSKRDRIIYLRKVTSNQKKMKRWAYHAPANYLHKWLLVEAEKARVLGKDIKTMDLFEKAIEKARENEYIQEEALANELAAKYYQAKGNKNIARTYIKNARYLYETWGAKAKVKHLDDNYSDLLYKDSGPRPSENEPTLTTITASFGATVEKLDLATVQKASEAISGEIHLDRLLRKMMKILIANAGAQKGYILLMDEKELFVEAEVLADEEEVPVLQHIPVEESTYIPQSIINYVLRTKKTVVIDDAISDDHFTNDDYIIQKKPKSLFCMPLIYQDKLSGILYLENNLTTSSFTTERVELLKMLTGQIVMSIENAQLYKNLEEYNITLEEKVEERTAEISQKNMALKQQKEEIETQRDEVEIQRDQLEIQRDLVLVQKQKITDSINYAKRIQTAVMPHQEYLDAVMPDYFVLFKPRDIVSGDFYWIKEIKNYLIIIAADCTGHGVPGAFMSMLGITLLNEQVGKSRIDKPGEILNHLRKKVKDTLAQEGKAYEQQDGMNMALAVIDYGSQKLQYAGSYIPLYIIRNKQLLKQDQLEQYGSLDNNDFQLFELKGDRQPISIYSEETEFTTKQIPFQKGDSIYLFTDGFEDQKGGPKRKKFLRKNLKRLLLEIQTKSMEEQKRSLIDTFENWSKGFEQVDDVLVIGLRL